MGTQTLEAKEFKPLKTTLSLEPETPKDVTDYKIDDIEPLVSPVEFEKSTGAVAGLGVAQPLAAGVGVADIVQIGATTLELIGKWSQSDAKPISFTCLPEADRTHLNYQGETFRAPKKRNYSKLFWTDSLWPCGHLTFHFDITSRARPKNTDKVPDGYYIPDITVVPHTRYAYPACALKVGIYRSHPTRIETEDGLPASRVKLLVDAHLVKLGIFDWKSLMLFEIDGDKIADPKVLQDPLPTPF